MSDTPFSDSRAFYVWTGPEDKPYLIEAETARELVRQLNEAKKELARALRVVEAACKEPRTDAMSFDLYAAIQEWEAGR